MHRTFSPMQNPVLLKVLCEFATSVTNSNNIKRKNNAVNRCKSDLYINN